MPLGADLTGFAQKRHLGRRFLRAQLIHQIVAVLDRQTAMARSERLHERASAREGVLAREVGVGEVGERVEGRSRVRRAERIDDLGECRERAGLHA
jgi:hypothetical protein